MVEALFYLYMIIGLVYGLYDWNVNQKEAYIKAEASGNIESGMIPVYWIFMFLFWSIFGVCELYKKKFK